MTKVDSSVPLMHHDPDRSWITDPDPDHPKGMHPLFINSGLKDIPLCIPWISLYHLRQPVLPDSKKQIHNW